MNRLNTITAAIRTAAAAPKNFTDLPLSAQTKVVFDCVKRAHKGMEWWNGQLNDESNDAAFRARAAREINIRQRTLAGAYNFLNRASHYSGGVEVEVEHIYTEGDIDSYDIHEESSYDTQVLNGNPHAWAKARLKSLGYWPEDDTVDGDAELSLWEPEKTYAKNANRYLAMVVLSEAGLYTIPPRKDDDGPSDVVMLAAMSIKFKLLGNMTGNGFVQEAMRLLKEGYKQYPFSATVYENGERKEQTFEAQDIINALKLCITRDQDDADAAALRVQAEEAKRERVALRKEITSITQQAITTATVIAEIANATKLMKESGMNDAVVESVMSKLLGQFVAPAAPAPTEEPPKAEEPTPPAVDPRIAELEAKLADVNALADRMSQQVIEAENKAKKMSDLAAQAQAEKVAKAAAKKSKRKNQMQQAFEAAQS